MLRYLPIEISISPSRWRFHLVRDGKDPMPLCRCIDGHTTEKAARNCYDVQRSLPQDMRNPPLEPDHI